ncbi:formate--tetrahydrofolate ligase [Sphingomonas piscis]|uniref:Formate--tetrahydrofolate ligase n=1 Tax=Sphingomonas piscis TaxID=2714943 RepID=A0A6G7YNK2_9SPHN|nr:formate--tetrahydrofolate ligase [Sphingomonas piscis]QIK78314.1 formate--tetrahydrofolate ligase [Sphingomonas piscis]
MTDLEIARAAKLRPLNEVAEKIGIPAVAVEPYGRFKAKLDLTAAPSGEKRGKLILVTAISPTLAGEGKSTTSVGLADAMNLIGRKTILCLREPSLGPCFGMKGGATGGGYAQVVPMEDINLHFTGDFHAITSAHNLLAAMVDNHIYWGNALGIDVRRVVWRRVMDMNDRALRGIVQSLGGATNGYPRESGFDITVASEVMAILCLANDLQDLEQRLSRIVVAYTRDKKPVTAGDLKADGAMAVLLKDAIRPNLVQTIENNPVLIHGGPFGNIAHGCNSVIATRTALSQADYVVTEAGFGADLGAEKFFDIKCRQSGLSPDAAVLVATVRALKLNGGIDKNDLNIADVDAVRRGSVNLVRHIENLRQFGVPVVVAINHFSGDDDAEVDVIRDVSRAHGSEAYVCRHWAEGGQGAVDLAQAVADLSDKQSAQFTTLYDDDLPLFEKINTIATRIYRAEEAVADPSIHQQLKQWEAAGLGHLPICIAKTQYSFSTDPNLKGAPTGHVVNVREVRLAAGAGFIVALCGEIMTMPGLPRHAAAEHIRLTEEGVIEGLS